MQRHPREHQSLYGHRSGDIGEARRRYGVQEGGGGEGGVEQPPRERYNSCERGGGGVGFKGWVRWRRTAAARTLMAVDALVGRGSNSEGGWMCAHAGNAAHDELETGSEGAEGQGLRRKKAGPRSRCALRVLRGGHSIKQPLHERRFAQGWRRMLQPWIDVNSVVCSPSEHHSSSRARGGGDACAGCALARWVGLRDGDAACVCVLVVAVSFRWEGGAKNGANTSVKPAGASRWRVRVVELRGDRERRPQASKLPQTPWWRF